MQPNIISQTLPLILITLITLTSTEQSTKQSTPSTPHTTTSSSPHSTTSSTPTEHDFTLDNNLFENISSLLLQNDHSFIKELISNSIDANKKLVSELKDIKADINKNILLTLNHHNNTFSVCDQGIGMSYDELTNYIGKVGGSGTRTNKKSDKDYIGQFGVGLYSALSVGDEISIVSRKYDSLNGYKLVFRKGETKYFIESVDTQPGTTVTIKISDKHIDKITEDIVKKWVKENVLRDPSNSNYKIQIRVINKEGKTVIREDKGGDNKVDGEGKDSNKVDDNNNKVDGEDKGSDKVDDNNNEVDSNNNTTDNTIPPTINTTTTPSGIYDLDITHWSYSTDLDILKGIFKRTFDATSTLLNAFNVRFNVPQQNTEGLTIGTTFEAMVFLPEISDMRMFGMENKGAIHVYVSGSKVHDPRLNKVPELLIPMYIIARSRDVQLTSSREEFLRSEITVSHFYNNLQSKIVDTIKDMSGKVLESYNTHIKSGLLNAKRDNNEKLVNKLSIILPFETPSGVITLGKFNEGITGDKLYYTTVPVSDYKMRGELKHPLFDGIDVNFFFLNGLTDEQVIQAMVKYDNKELLDIVTYGVEVKDKSKEWDKNKDGDKDSKDNTPVPSTGNDFIDFALRVLKSDCSDVVISKRLKECPFCVKMENRRMSTGMKSVLGVNTIQSSVFRQLFEVKPILEVNIEHEEVKRLEELCKVDEERATVLLKGYFVGTSVICGIDIYDKVGSYIWGVNNGRIGLGLEMVRDVGMVETGAKISVGEDKNQKGYGYKEEEESCEESDNKEGEDVEDEVEEEYKSEVVKEEDMRDDDIRDNNNGNGDSKESDNGDSKEEL